MNEIEEFTLRWRGRETGPFSIEEINRLLDDHKIGMAHEIFHRDKWMTLEEFLVPAPEPVLPPPPPPPRVRIPAANEMSIPAPAPPAVAKKAKRRMVFGLLAVFTGFIGLHNFYARQWLTGLLQLLLSVATWLMGFGIIAAWIWAAVEAIFVHKDGDGIEMI